MHQNSNILQISIRYRNNPHTVPNSIPNPLVAFGMVNTNGGIVDKLETVHGEVGAMVELILGIVGYVLF